MNTPIASGTRVLAGSKLSLYRFYWDVLKKLFPGIEFDYCDMDSLYVSIPEDAPTVFEKMRCIADEWLDTSNLSDEHLLARNRDKNKNKERLKTFKFEYKDEQIRKTIVDGSKKYMVILDSDKTEIKCKGVKKETLKNIGEQEFVKKREVKLLQGNICAVKCTLYTELMKKVVISEEPDPKRCHVTDNLSVAWGHWRLIQHKDSYMYIPKTINLPAKNTLGRLCLEKLHED